jgi:hypothetical protein
MADPGALERRLDELADRLDRLEDVNAIRTVQYAYGYYLDKHMYDEVVDLFADDAELMFLNGVYKGKAGVRRLYCDWFRTYFTKGINGPIYGFLYEHLLMQDIIHVAPDRRTAKGRARCFMQGGSHESRTDIPDGLPTSGFWEGGIYENDYVHEDGVWKIKRLDYNMLWQASYEKGWGGSEAHLRQLSKLYPDDPLGPDEIREGATPVVWPHTRKVPFHFVHPVTGRTTD